MSPILQWLVSSGIGFVIGYVVCLGVRRTVEAEDSPNPVVAKKGERVRTFFGVLLVFLAGFGYYQVYRTNDCFRDALQLRSEAQGSEIRAQIDLLEAGLADPGNRARSIENTKRYLGSIRQLERVRTETPLEC